MRAQAERIGPATLTRYAEIVHTGLIEMRGATAPRLLVELLCARMLLPAASATDAAVLQRLEGRGAAVDAGSRWHPPPAPAAPAAIGLPPSRSRSRRSRRRSGRSRGLPGPSRSGSADPGRPAGRARC